MNKFILALALVAATIAAQAQGTLRFNNKNQTDSIDAKVSYVTTGLGAGAGITAELVLVGTGGSLTALTPTSTFGTTTPTAAFYFSNKDVSVPGIAAGQTANFMVRAYSTSAGSYDAALTTAGAWHGFSGTVSVTLGGVPAGGGAPITSPNLKGLQGFTLEQTIIPEPATVALLGLGGAALLIRRRK